MTNITINLIKNSPFHLVYPSPWPLNTSISLFALAFSAVLIFQNFVGAVDILVIVVIGIILSICLWFRDVI